MKIEQACLNSRPNRGNANIRSIWKAFSILGSAGNAVGLEVLVLPILVLTPVVVLLDEADVFLEKRSNEDMNRNALVSGTQIPCNDCILLTNCA